MKKKKTKIKTEKQFITWIEQQIKFYSPYLGLQLHDVRVKRFSKQNDNPDDFLAIDCTYPYLDPNIRYSRKVFEEWAHGNVRKDRILHELIHIITDPLFCKAITRYVSQNEIKDEREKLTDTFAAIIRNLIK